MLLLLSLSLLLSGALEVTSGSTLKPFHDMNTGEALKYLHEKILSLENRETSDLTRKTKEEIKDELTAKLEEMEVSFINKHNDLSTKQQELEERVSEEKESLSELSETLLKERDERLSLDNHILMEVQELQRGALETAMKINIVKNEIRSVSEEGRNKTDVHEVKVNEMKELVRSCLASQRNTEDVILKSMSSSDEILKILINHSSEISSINTLIRIQNRCSDPPHVKNGYPINRALEFTNHGDVITYTCWGNRIPAGNDMMECHFGKWIGELPQCVNHYPQRENGSTTPAWPWMADVERKNGFHVKCAGSIIHRHFVQTAAYCAHDMRWTPLNETDLTVKLGVTDFRDLTHLQEYNVRRIYFHSLFNRDSFWEYNIALLELEKPIDYNLYIRPVYLPPKETPEDNRYYQPRTPAHLIGWYYDRYLQTYLLKESLRVIQPPEDCSKKYEEFYYYRNDTDRMFCAAEDFKEDFVEVDWCLMTYGGVTVQSHQNEEGTSVWTQVGIEHKGCRSDGKKVYSFFTHVQKLMPWIDKTIEDASKR